MTTINAAAKAITGTKTPAQKAAELAKRTARPRGGKPGSAMANQSAEYVKDAEGTPTAKARGRAIAPKTPAPVKPSDVINGVKSVTGSDHTAVTAPGQETILLRPLVFGQVSKLATVGGSYKALKAAVDALPKSQGKLANGLDARSAPHAAKAVADNAAAARKASTLAKADPVAAKLKSEGKLDTAKVIAQKAMGKPAKADAPAKAAVAPTGIDRKYKATKKEDASKPDSFRRYMIATIRAHGSTARAKEAHAASGKFSHERLNFKWAHDNGYIVIADLTK